MPIPFAYNTEIEHFSTPQPSQVGQQAAQVTSQPSQQQQQQIQQQPQQMQQQQQQRQQQQRQQQQEMQQQQQRQRQQQQQINQLQQQVEQVNQQVQQVVQQVVQQGTPSPTPEVVPAWKQFLIEHKNTIIIVCAVLIFLLILVRSGIFKGLTYGSSVMDDTTALYSV